MWMEIAEFLKFFVLNYSEVVDGCRESTKQELPTATVDRFPKKRPDAKKTPKPEGNDCCVCAPFVSVGDYILMIPKTLCKVQPLKTAFNQRVLTSNFPPKTELRSLDNLDLHPPWTSYTLLKKHLVRGRQISVFTAQALLLGLQRPPSLKVLGPMSSLKKLQGWKFTPENWWNIWSEAPPFLVTFLVGCQCLFWELFWIWVIWRWVGWFLMQIYIYILYSR